MPRKAKSDPASSSPATSVAPPIENDIFAEDIKWLQETSIKNGNSKPNGSSSKQPPTTAIEAAAAASINTSIGSNTVPSYIETTTITSPNTVPVTPTVPMVPSYPEPVPTAPPYIPAIPVVPTIPQFPNIPDYSKPTNIPNYNLMNNQNNLPQQIFVNETSLWSMEWTIPTIRTVDVNGVEIASYKDVVCSIRTYANDVYNADQVSEASRWVFAMIHTVMDAVRKHSYQINPEGGVDYLASMDPNMLEIITSFRKRVLDKRLGYPRVTVKCRYGFKMPDSNVDVKIEAYEHTDPIEFYTGIMKYLEPMRRIELMHLRLEEQIIEQRKQTFGTAQAPVAQSQQTQQYAPQRPATPPPQQPSYTAPVPPPNPGAATILDCRNDDEAQDAPFNTLLAYHAVRVFRKDGKFNFYMPPASGDQRARPRGIYAYEQGKGASPVIEQALRDGRLPPLQNGEAVDYEVTIIALKVATQSGNAKYDVKDIVRK